jgi:hypothetical protein
MKEDIKNSSAPLSPLSQFLQNPSQAKNLLVLLNKLETLEAKWEKAEDILRYDSAN